MQRLLSTVLVTTLLLLATPTVSRATSKAEREAAKRARRVDRLKQDLARLGTGPDARIEVRTHDAKTIKGYVSTLGDSSFVVIDASSTQTQVPYGDVTKVKGHNLATGWKIGIGAGIAFAILLILLWTEAIGDAET
jgi:type II secretory pathway pseudopilin PulG